MRGTSEFAQSRRIFSKLSLPAVHQAGNLLLQKSGAVFGGEKMILRPACASSGQRPIRRRIAEN